MGAMLTRPHTISGKMGYIITFLLCIPLIHQLYCIPQTIKLGKYLGKWKFVNIIGYKKLIGNYQRFNRG